MAAEITEQAFDPLRETPPVGGDEIRKATSESVRAGVDIRARIHDVTLLALRSRRFDRHGMRDVVQAVTVGNGAGCRGKPGGPSQGTCGSASRDGRGADALRRRKPRRAEHFVVTGRDLSDNEIKQALANMKRLEDDFPVSTAGQAADTHQRESAARAQAAARRCAHQNGTETGRMAATTLQPGLTQRFSIASLDVALASVEVATEVGSRLEQLLAGGILSGIADALPIPVRTGGPSASEA